MVETNVRCIHCNSKEVVKTGKYILMIILPITMLYQETYCKLVRKILKKLNANT